MHTEFTKDGKSDVPKDWKKIGKDLDGNMLPLNSMARRFFSLLKFMHAEGVFSSWPSAQEAADALLSGDIDVPTDTHASTALPSAPKRSRHWLLENDAASVDVDREFRPGFYLELARYLACRYGNDSDLMTSWVLKDHPLDVLKVCGKSSAAELLATTVAMVAAKWPEIVAAGEARESYPLLGLSALDVSVAVRTAEWRRSTAPIWKTDDSKVDLSTQLLPRF